LSESKENNGLIRFWAELKRRRVVRVVTIYVVVGWLVIGAAETLLPNLNLPEWSVTLVIALIVLAFPLVIALAWMLDVGPQGIETTKPLDSQLAASTELTNVDPLRCCRS
jgi:adenylate cyclase